MVTAVAVLALSLVGVVAFYDAPSNQMAGPCAVVAFVAGARIAYLMAKYKW